MAVAMLAPCTEGGLWQFACGLPSRAWYSGGGLPVPTELVLPAHVLQKDNLHSPTTSHTSYATRFHPEVYCTEQ